jgi:hypothetical protein
VLVLLPAFFVTDLDAKVVQQADEDSDDYSDSFEDYSDDFEDEE